MSKQLDEFIQVSLDAVPEGITDLVTNEVQRNGHFMPFLTAHNKLTADLAEIFEGAEQLEKLTEDLDTADVELLAKQYNHMVTEITSTMMAHISFTIGLLNLMFDLNLIDIHDGVMETVHPADKDKTEEE